MERLQKKKKKKKKKEAISSKEKIEILFFGLNLNK